MHFKHFLVFYSIYFFTEVWSVGLNQDDISSIVRLVENYRKQNGGYLRIKMEEYKRRDEGFNRKFHNDVNDCVYKLDGVSMIDDESLPDLLVYLAKLEKLNDDWRGKSMITFEVNIFMTTFKEKDKKGVQDGLLTYAELENLINVDVHLEHEFENKIKNEFKNGDSINALMFLAVILKHKPEGRGLDRKQIKKCSALYTTYYGRLPRKSLRNLLHSLHIVSKKYFRLIEFDQRQPAALELQELLVFWSEYNKKVEEKASHFSSTDVRHLIHEFSMYDLDNDGVLRHSEFIPLARTYLPKNPRAAVSYLSKIPELKSVVKIFELARSDPLKRIGHNVHDHDCSMTSATFLHMKYYLTFERNKDKSDIAPTKILNDWIFGWVNGVVDQLNRNFEEVLLNY